MGSKFLIIGQLPPPHHGSNVMTEIFVNSLKELGADVTIVEKTFSKKLEDIGKLTIPKIIKIPFLTSSLVYHLIRKKIDICFYFMSIKPPSIFFDAFFLSIIKLFRVHCVLYLHGKGIINLDDKISQPLRSFVKKSISNSLGAIVLGERLKGDINHLIPDEKLFVLPNTLSDIKSKNSEINFNKKGQIKILYLSNVVPSKGPLEFLKMAMNINRIDKKVKFILAGPNRDIRFFNDIKMFIQNWNLNDCVILYGPVYGEEKEKLFEECEIFVFPTYYELEAFPLVLLEAMRAGLAIVSSDEGSIPEIVIDGVNGFIVNPKDIGRLTESVFKLIQDPELRMNMGCSGKEIFKNKFTIDSYKKNLGEGLEFFFDLMEKSDKESICFKKLGVN